MRTIDDIFASENADENLDLMRLFNTDANKDDEMTDEEKKAEECGKKCCQDLAFENYQFDEESFLADADDEIEDDAKSGTKADLSDLEKEDKDTKDDKKDDDKDDDDKDKKDDDKDDDDKGKKDDDDDKKDDDNADKKGEDGDECFKFEAIESDFLSNEEYFDIFNDDVAPATNVNDPQDDVEHPDDDGDNDDDDDDDDKKKCDGKKCDDEPAKDEVVGLGDSDTDLGSLFAFMDDDLL